MAVVDGASEAVVVSHAARGEGSVFQLPSGLWKAEVTVRSWRDDKGKWRSKQVSGTGATKELAIQRRAKNSDKWKVRTGQLPISALNVAPSELKLTVRDWLETWVADPTLDVNERVRKGYKNKIMLHICGPGGIGAEPLATLTDGDVRDFVARLAVKKASGSDEPVLAPEAIYQTFSILKRALKEAVNQRKIALNPCDAVKAPPRKPKNDRTRRAAKVREQRADLKEWMPKDFLSRIKGEPDEVRWWLAFMGLRQGEVLGLRIRDIDLRNHTLSVNNGLVRYVVEHGCGKQNPRTGLYPCGKKRANACPQRTGEPGLYLADPKSADSVRSLAVPEPVFSLLQQQIVRQNALRKLSKDDFAPLPGMEDLLFTTLPKDVTVTRRKRHSTETFTTTRHYPGGKPIRQQDDAERRAELLEGLYPDDPSLSADERRRREQARTISGHFMRHLTVSLLSAMGYTAEVIQKITGWSDTMMMTIYNEMSLRDTEKPLQDLSDFITGRREELRAKPAPTVASAQQRAPLHKLELAVSLADKVKAAEARADAAERELAELKAQLAG